MRKSVIHDFQACSSKNCSIYDAEISYNDFQAGSSKNCSIYDAEISFTRFLDVLKQKLFDLQLGNQLYTIFRRAQAKIVRFTTRKSVIHDFQAYSSKHCSIYDAEIIYTRFSGALDLRRGNHLHTIFRHAQAKII